MSAQAQRGNLAVRLVISFGLLLVAVLVLFNRQYLIDQTVVWQFKPTAEVAAVSEGAHFSEQGKFLFYASRPELLERNAFNEACRSSTTEQTAVLGCYTLNRIYLFDIDNKQLAGIKEVTAAHEMLHAAYQRLSSDEKKRVDGLLEAQSFGPDEARINELLSEYAKSEPGERLNELHSIIGTEVRNLNPELEAYYAQLFADRAKVVTLSEQYQTVFTQLKSRQESLSAELNKLADAIEQQGAAYKRNLQVLSSDVQSFNVQARSGQMTRAEYDSQRAELEMRQDSLKRQYDMIQALIAQYETKRSELASINTEANALNRSINSSLAPVPDAIDG